MNKTELASIVSAQIFARMLGEYAHRHDCVKYAAESAIELIDAVQNKIFALSSQPDTLPMRTYALFEGRHELPPHEGSLYSAETTGPFGLVEAPARAEAIAHFAQGGTVAVVVTGLTAALLDFVAACHEIAVGHAAGNGGFPHMGHLVALHFDRESGKYLPQRLI